MLPLQKAGNFPVQTIQPVMPTMSAASTNNTPAWLSGIGDSLSMGIDLWRQTEQVLAIKDATGQARNELDNTVQVESPQVVETVVQPANPAQKQFELGVAGLKVGAGTLLLVFGGIGFLWWLSRK
ncbi:hypothetical protein EXU30_00065 [Shewanella maritima]|uniref:Uncharacterized protein n=1 Tax=Shewanella maritima TaxID=2520507 RepID=A0A411PCM9_9GAMM|nr:hypothetical protein [Shewanella maritima]QBF81264.1 hypothetical protein EXU30_00065 [Shewanella maritima]